MSLSQVRSLTGDKYPAHRFSMTFNQHRNPTEAGRVEEWYMYDNDSGVILYFDRDQVLVRKMRKKLFGIDMPKLLDSFR